MSRPHIEFVHEQVLPWETGLYGGARPEVHVRTLSRDDETGASSLLLRYPPGWRREEPEHLLADEEFFVLSGSLEINGAHYHDLCYGFFPAGHVRESASSPDGALVLTFFEGEPRRAEGRPANPMDAERLVERLHMMEGDWGAGFHPLFPPGAGRKYLRKDPYDGEHSWILGTMPLRFGRRREKHPVVEEMFLLAGELVGPFGAMHAGAYFWRPPEIWHGPFGTKTGYLTLFRTKGGPLSTEFDDNRLEFSWTPEYRPVLPPRLAEFARSPYQGRPPW